MDAVGEMMPTGIQPVEQPKSISWAEMKQRAVEAHRKKMENGEGVLGGIGKVFTKIREVVEVGSGLLATDQGRETIVVLLQEKKNQFMKYAGEQTAEVNRGLNQLAELMDSQVEKGVEKANQTIDAGKAWAASTTAELATAPAEAVYGQAVNMTGRMDRWMTRTTSEWTQRYGEVVTDVAGAGIDASEFAGDWLTRIAESSMMLTRGENKFSRAIWKVAKFALGVNEQAQNAQEAGLAMEDFADELRHKYVERSKRRGEQMASFRQNRKNFVANPAAYLQGQPA